MAPFGGPKFNGFGAGSALGEPGPSPRPLLDERASGQEPPGDLEIKKMLDLWGGFSPSRTPKMENENEKPKRKQIRTRN